MPDADTVIPRRRAARQLTLVPLVDVVFILLLFFMLETNFLQPRAVDLALTRPGTGQVAATSSLYLELQDDGTTWLNGVRIDPGDMAGPLARLGAGTDTRAVVAADRGVRVQRVVAMVEALHRSAVTSISLRDAERFH